MSIIRVYQFFLILYHLIVSFRYSRKLTGTETFYLLRRLLNRGLNDSITVNLKSNQILITDIRGYPVPSILGQNGEIGNVDCL